MRFITLVNLNIFMLVLPISVLCAEEKQAIKTLEAKYSGPNWVDAISKDVTAVTIELKAINKEAI